MAINASSPAQFTDDQRILTQYGLVLFDLIVLRARQAGARTGGL